MIRRLRAGLFALLLAGFVTESAQADFDPKGRRRPGAASPRPARPTAKPSTPSTKPATTKPAKPSPAERPSAERPTEAPTAAAPDDDSAGTDAVRIQRYKALVLSQPGAQFPLQRLAELVRKRDGSLDSLLREFEEKAAQAGPGQYAALVALAGLNVQAGQPQLAAATYERAIALSPSQPLALVALGHLRQQRAENAAARELFERALPLLTDDAERETLLRTLLKLALDLDDLPAAKRVHEQLVRRAKGSFFVQTELGNELLARGKFDAAELEFRRVVKLAQGDNRALAPALRDLGVALHRQHKADEAIATLQQALKLTSAASGLRRELLDVMVEVYRGADRLPQIITLLEQDTAQDFARLRLLASLYEERGQLALAAETYRKALRLNSKDLDVRLHLVRLLQLQGELDKAIAEYRQLISAAPHNPTFVFQLVDALLQQGQRVQAVAELRKLEARAAGDEQIQAALVEFYERVGEKERSLALLEQLARGAATDDEHVIELGDRYFQAGDTALAERTWKRLLVGTGNRAAALAKLGEVYLDHNLPQQALLALEEAVQLAPNENRYKRALALALERTGASESKAARLAQYERALHLWEKLLTSGKADPNLAREARQHMVTLWGLAGTLEARLAPLERNLKAQPPDLESGRLLALMYERLKRAAQAQRVLNKVIAAAPGDVQSLLQLERVLVSQRKLHEAIAVLKKLLQADPSRAREIYQRMANYSVELYRDDEAIGYAERAVELSPDDAQGHKNLADMYARRQDAPRAIAQYRRALRLNDRLFPAYFDLAELLLARGERAEADQLLRRVMRSALDEELIARAVRLSLQIHLNQGNIEELEKDLLPLALSNPDKPVYRRLLIEVYSAAAMPLIQAARGGSAAGSEQLSAASQALARLGQRAIKPLLDALTDPQSSQQQVAIDVLTHLKNEHASQALLVYATSDAPTDLRVRAMVAACAPGQVQLLPHLQKVLFAARHVQVDEGDPVVLAAVWGLTQIRSETTDALLVQLLGSDSPSAQMLAAVALGQRRAQRGKAPLLSILESTEHAPSARAAASFALGELGAKDAAVPLEKALSDADPRVQAAALVALARIAPAAAAPAIANALTNPEARLQTAALGAAGLLGGGVYASAKSPLAPPDGRVDTGQVLAALQPRTPTADERARAITLLEAPLSESIAELAQRTPEQVREWSAALLAADGQPALGELSRGIEGAAPALRAAALASLGRVAQSAVAPFARLASHPMISVRRPALLFLARNPAPLAREALLAALQDPEPEIRRLVLAELAQRPFPGALQPVMVLLQEAQDWGTRVLAMQALSRFPQLSTEQTAAERRAVQALGEFAEQDPVAFVREAALAALLNLDPSAARPTLLQVAQKDPEERVRKLATAGLGQSPGAPAAPAPAVSGDSESAGPAEQVLP